MTKNTVVVQREIEFRDHKGKLLEAIGIEGDQGRFIEVLPVKLKPPVAQGIIFQSPQKRESLQVRVFRGKEELVKDCVHMATYNLGGFVHQDGQTRIRLVLGYKEGDILFDAIDLNSKQGLKIERVGQAKNESFPASKKPDPSKAQPAPAKAPSPPSKASSGPSKK